MACADAKLNQYVVHTIPGKKYVGAVTSLGGEIYVARLNDNFHQSIEVYDATSFKPRQSIVLVPGRGYCVWGLVACGRYKCLYVSDWGNDKIHRVELCGVRAVMMWSVARKPAGLSLTNQHNLLVVSQGQFMLQEFTTHGILLWNIQLQGPGPDYPPNYGCPDQVVWQAVQLPDGNFMISFFGAGRSQMYCSEQPRLVGIAGRESSDWNRPAGLAVDKDGRVLIADWYNNRLMVDDSLLEVQPYRMQPCYYEIPVPVEGGLKGPCSLSYDQERKRLYIGECEWGSYRVIVVDNVNDFSRSPT